MKLNRGFLPLLSLFGIFGVAVARAQEPGQEAIPNWPAPATWSPHSLSRGVSTMLLNEFLKQHRQVQEQQKQIEKLTAQLKEQAAQIRKVNDKVEMSRPAPRTVENNQ